MITRRRRTLHNLRMGRDIFRAMITSHIPVEVRSEMDGELTVMLQCNWKPPKGRFVTLPVNEKNEDEEEDASDEESVDPRMATAVRVHPDFFASSSHMFGGLPFLRFTAGLGKFVYSPTRAHESAPHRIGKTQAEARSKLGCDVPYGSGVDAVVAVCRWAVSYFVAGMRQLGYRVHPVRQTGLAETRELFVTESGEPVCVRGTYVETVSVDSVGRQVASSVFGTSIRAGDRDFPSSVFMISMENSGSLL